jgi:N-methylhydantoinase B
MVANETVLPGEWIVGIDCGGGGYGDPRSREPQLVLRDVLEGWVSLEAARDLYGVVLSGSVEDQALVIDFEETARQRKSSPNRQDSPSNVCQPRSRLRMGASAEKGYPVSSP